jgi:hypothetical protein
MIETPVNNRYSNGRRVVVGRVLRASTIGFDCGTRGSRMDERYTFGAFVKAPLGDDDRLCAIGLIYAIRIDDDPLARELVMAAGVDNSTLLDQRDNRMVPVEVCVVNVGYCLDGQMVHTLPPRPPLSLCEVELLTPDEILQFTRRNDYFRLVLNAREVPAEELIAAALRYAAGCYDESVRREFMVGCGRQLVGLLSHDLKRLHHIVEMIRV